VYVRTDVDGYLIVLRRRDDGSVEVLVPETPSRASYAAAGTYQVLGPEGGAAFTVLAALAPVPFRPGEFARHDAWDGDALAAPSGAGDESALTEIVQRMLGDESFNYDLATYAGVAPPTVVVVVDSVFVLPAELPVAAYYYGPPFVADFARVVDFGERHSQRFQRRAHEPVSVAPRAALAVYERGRLAVVPTAVAAPTRTRPPAAAPRMLPPIVIVQRHIRPSQENPAGLMARTLTSGTAPPTPVVRRAAVTSAVAYVPAMPTGRPVSAPPRAPQAVPVRASGASPPPPRTFALPHYSGPAVIVPARR
jgi:hypothetical protein